MSASAELSPNADKMALLEKLRARYEAEGFSFTSVWQKTDLPTFMGQYRPDAIARKHGLNIAIEVKSDQSVDVLKTLDNVRKIFAGQPGWQLAVFYAGSEPFGAMPIAPASPRLIRERMDEVSALSAAGHRQAAFVLAWSLLEAALVSLDEGRGRQPSSPEAVLQALAFEGHIDPHMERSMRPMIALRNRIVHGDVAAEPTVEDVSLVLAALDHALADEPV